MKRCIYDSLVKKHSSKDNHHTINSLKRPQEANVFPTVKPDKFGNTPFTRQPFLMLLVLSVLIILAIKLPAIYCDIHCPKDLTPIYPCSCNNGTHGLLIKCSKSNLAILSISLRNLNEQDTVEQVEIEYSSVSRLFGPIFSDSTLFKFHSTIRELDIRASGLKSIDAGSISVILQKNIQYLMLDRNQLQQVPLDLLNSMPNLKLLNLSSNQIGAIDGNSFTKLANLSELDLSNNHISRLNRGAFNSLNSLEYLSLSKNEINKLEKNLFTFGRKLRSLDLSGNKLTTLDRQDFNELTSLETLRVANNQLTTIPRSIFSRNAKLYNLDLSFNRLEDIDTYLFKSTRFLRDLNISGNLIKELTKNTFSPTTRIKRIDLSQNLLQALAPETFKNLEWLEKIDLSHNQIVNISNDAFNHIFSVDIDLSSNRLTRIFYYAFHDVSNITRLNLSHNLIDDGISLIAFEQTDCAQLDLSYNQIQDISKIPISNLTGIRILDISHNQITEFNKKSFTQKFPLYELHTIDSSYNNISQISGNILERLKSVRFLNISHNSLRRLTSGSFGNSPTLLELDLSYNNLVEVVAGTLVGLVSMKNLDMSYNRLKKMIPIPVALNSIHLEYNEISQLSRSAFPSLNSLLELYLDHNRISHIEEQTFSTLLALHTLSLRYNNITSVPAAALKDLASLQLLRFDGNNIQRLGRKAFGVLPIVFELYLDHNNISSVADHAFEGMLQLLTLNLSHNSILELPPEAFSGLVSLRNLDLSNNQLNRFENKTRSVMEDLLSLEVANFSNNKLSMITQKTFLSSPYIPYRLTRLDLSNNLIGILANNFANGLKKVEWLSLRNNIINEIYPNVIGNASSLVHLDLSHNKLRYLKDGTFNGLFSNLTTILLNNNRLTSVRPEEFQHLRNLIYLDLSTNRLESFPSEFIRWVKRGMALDLRQNYLECSCNLLPLIAWADVVLSTNHQTANNQPPDGKITIQHNQNLVSQSAQSAQASSSLLLPSEAETSGLLSQFQYSSQLIAGLNCSKPDILSGKSLIQMVNLAISSEMNCDRTSIEEADLLRRMKSPLQYTGAEPQSNDGLQQLKIGWNLMDPQLDVLNFIIIKAKFEQPIDLSAFRSNRQRFQPPQNDPQLIPASKQLMGITFKRVAYNQRTLVLTDLDPTGFYVICISYESSTSSSSTSNDSFISFNMIDLESKASKVNETADIVEILSDYIRFNCVDLNSLLQNYASERLVSHASTISYGVIFYLILLSHTALAMFFITLT